MMDRREFLRLSALGAAAFTARRMLEPLGPACFAHSGPQSTRVFVPDIELELTANPAQHQILSGGPTNTWAYSAKLLKGRPGTLDESGSYLGPDIHLRKGDKVRVHFHNAIPETTIVHWHGLVVPGLMDGHPRLVVPQGAEYIYEFEVQNRAGHYWYHPHPDDRTGPQTYRGLAGNLFVHDHEESSLRLPSGEHEIPLVIQDRTFDGDHQLTYLSGHMDAMIGFLGNRILVNGAPDRELQLATAAYRLRFLNASNSRIYKLAWSDGRPMNLIGTDGGLLERPVTKPYLALAPAERADVILDLGRLPVGSSLELRSLAFPAPQMMMGRGMGGMMGGRMGAPSGLPQGSAFRVLRLRVLRKENSRFRLPARLSQPGFLSRQAVENPDQPRVYSLSFMRMQWLLNDSTFEMEAAKENEIFKAGSVQLIEFSNSGMGMMGMMQMSHPMHLHGGQFQLLKRTAGSDDMSAALREGLTDEGWKDTILVMPGERVQLMMRFPSFKGLFLYHCHNLEHEDMGMMRNYRVT